MPNLLLLPPHLPGMLGDWEASATAPLAVTPPRSTMTRSLAARKHNTTNKQGSVQFGDYRVSRHPV